MIANVPSREGPCWAAFRQHPAGVIDVPAAHSQQLGGLPLGKEESIVQICTMLTLLEELVGLRFRVAARLTGVNYGFNLTHL